MKRKDVGKHPGLYDYAGKFRYLTAASLVFSGISAVLALMPFVYIWFIIRDVTAVAPDFAAATEIGRYGWMAVLFAALSVLVYVCGLMCSHIAAFRVASNIKKRTLEHVVTLPAGAFDAVGSGKIRKIIDESSAATETYLAHNLPDMTGSYVTPLAMVVMMFVFDWRLGLACLVPSVVAFVILYTRMIGGGLAEKMKQYNDALADMNNEAVEYVRGVPVVKTFGQTVYSFARLKNSIERYNVWTVAYTKQLRQPMMFFTLFIDSAFAFLLGAALIIVGSDPVDPAFFSDLLFYIIFSPLLAVMLNRIMYSSENKMVVNDAMNRINSVLDMQPLAEPEKPCRPSGNGIEFRDVHFRYPSAETDAVDGVSFIIDGGSRVAFVGESGGGKTTVAGLIARFWDATQGEILFGGVNVRDIDKKTLADSVAYVFQDNRLLKTTIAENVRLSRPDASDEEVLRALKAAQCEDIIAKLPEGVGTVIGSKGTYLSGGEQQRIAIARAILKDAPVIVLDEATAFADPENEHKVQLAFERLTRGKTVVMIAHRLSTVVDADEIFVLKKGRIAEHGRHSDLVGRGGEYAKMWREYLTSVEWKIAREA